MAARGNHIKSPLSERASSATELRDPSHRKSCSSQFQTRSLDKIYSETEGKKPQNYRTTKTLFLISYILGDLSTTELRYLVLILCFDPEKK